MRLRKLEEKDYEKFKELSEEYSLSGDDRYKEKSLSREAYSNFLTELSKFENKETIPPHLVPGYCFWLVDESDTLLGAIRLRKYLNDNLKIEGGHIGYDIRPSVRNKGLGTKMLSLCLEKAKELKLEKVLITCFTDNPASAKVIERNGGVLESIEPSPRNGKDTKRYWVTLTAPKS
jgi:predicted acetyltransferase